MREGQGVAGIRQPGVDTWRTVADAVPASLKTALTARERRVLPAVTEPQDSGIVYQHSVLCHTALPYRNPGAVRRWSAQNGFVTLEVEAGRVFDPRMSGFVDVGLPYGPKPRLALYHLNAEALRTGSRVIELERSLTGFVRRTLGLDVHGRNIQTVKEQLTRLAACEFRIGIGEGADGVTVHGPILNGLTLWTARVAQERDLWPTQVQFSEGYFESLSRHAVPLNEAAVGKLSHNAMALDIYTWLAQRLHRIERHKAPLVPWSCLARQFGNGYAQVRAFRRVFLRTLAQVRVVYPSARLEATQQGLKLALSAPPIARRAFMTVTTSSSGADR